MADKYIALLSGIETEVEGKVTGGTAAEAGKIPALDSTGRLDESLMPVGIGADMAVLTAAEALSAGALVYIKSDGEVANASGASAGNEAVGFVLAAYSASDDAYVYFEGRNTELSGLTVGARYYLSDLVAGGITATPIDNTNPANAGKKHQYVGRAISATSLSFEASDSVVLA